MRAGSEHMRAERLVLKRLAAECCSRVMSTLERPAVAQGQVPGSCWLTAEELSCHRQRTESALQLQHRFIHSFSQSHIVNGIAK